MTCHGCCAVRWRSGILRSPVRDRALRTSAFHPWILRILRRRRQYGGSSCSRRVPPPHDGVQSVDVFRLRAALALVPVPPASFFRCRKLVCCFLTWFLLSNLLRLRLYGFGRD